MVGGTRAGVREWGVRERGLWEDDFPAGHGWDRNAQEKEVWPVDVSEEGGFVSGELFGWELFGRNMSGDGIFDKAMCRGARDLFRKKG